MAIGPKRRQNLPGEAEKRTTLQQRGRNVAPRSVAPEAPTSSGTAANPVDIITERERERKRKTERERQEWMRGGGGFMDTVTWGKCISAVAVQPQAC